MFRMLVASFLFTACAFSSDRRVHFLSALDAPDEEVLFFLYHLLMNETTGVSFAVLPTLSLAFSAVSRPCLQ